MNIIITIEDLKNLVRGEVIAKGAHQLLLHGVGRSELSEVLEKAASGENELTEAKVKKIYSIRRCKTDGCQSMVIYNTFQDFPKHCRICYVKKESVVTK